MSCRLRDFIKNISACKTQAEERAYVAKESALIRTAFREGNLQQRHRNIAKLLFIQMLGYPTHFTQIDCVKLVASQKFNEKKVGYLGITQLFDEESDVLMLSTNSIENDINVGNRYITY